MRDFAAELSTTRCWDAGVQAVYERTGEPAVDCVLQTRGELVALCEFMEAQRIRRFLEIGLWSGRLWCLLHDLFALELVAGCDDGYAQRRLGLPLHRPPGGQLFTGNSRSAGYLAWRRSLGPLDLVLIDGDHTAAGVLADLQREQALPHRFLALHDITGSNRHTVGVAAAWQGLRAGSSGGYTREILCAHTEIGAAGSTMGIGIWSATELP